MTEASKLNEFRLPVDVPLIGANGLQREKNDRRSLLWTPTGNAQVQTVPQSSAWANVERVLLKHQYEPDVNAARILYASVAAHRLVGSPVWPMLVAPPGSLKTELLNALDGLPGIHHIDQVTPQTFISGQIAEPGSKNERASSLLMRIGAQGIIVYPDFSTVLAMRAESKASVLADMRRIYDGRLHKEFGTSEPPRDWQGRITFVVAVTPEIDRYYSIFQTLGERFVMVRWPRAGGKEAALRAMDQQSAEAKTELKEAVHKLFEAMPPLEPTIPEEIKHRIAALTEFAVRGRTHVPRSSYDKRIEYVPEPESATRLAQQLAQLGKGLALISGRDYVSDEDYRLVRRAGMDCIPPNRSKIVEVLMAGGKLRDAKLPPSTLQYAKEEMETQDLLSGDRLSELAVKLLTDADLLPYQPGFN